MWRKWCDNKKIYLCINKYIYLQVYGAQKKITFKNKKRSKSAQRHHKRRFSNVAGSQNNNCRQFGALATVYLSNIFLFLTCRLPAESTAAPQSLSLSLSLSLSTSQPNWKPIQTCAKFSFFFPFFSGQDNSQNGQPKWEEVGWIFWKMSENCYRCFCHVGLKLKSPINGKTVMSGPLIYYYPHSSQADWHAKQAKQASLSPWGSVSCVF